MERLRELFKYDQKTGQFIWKVRNGRRIRVGQIAGSLNADGYVRVRIDGISYQAHRLIWKHVTGEEPPTSLDHKDLDKCNNRITNLRPATHGLNGANRRLRKDNKTGFKGVSRLSRGCYQAYVRFDRKLIVLGYFLTPEEAHAAYCAAARDQYGEFFCAG